MPDLTPYDPFFRLRGYLMLIEEIRFTDSLASRPGTKKKKKR